MDAGFSRARRCLEVTVGSTAALKENRASARADPFAVLRLGGAQHRTDGAAAAGSRPVWNHRFSFLLPQDARDMPEDLDVEIWDRTDNGTDKFIGSCKVNLTAVFRKGSVDMVQAVHRKSGKLLGHIRFHLCLLVEDPSAERDSPSPPSHDQMWSPIKSVSGGEAVGSKHALPSTRTVKSETLPISQMQPPSRSSGGGAGESQGISVASLPPAMLANLTPEALNGIAALGDLWKHIQMALQGNVQTGQQNFGTQQPQQVQGHVLSTLGGSSPSPPPPPPVLSPTVWANNVGPLAARALEALKSEAALQQTAEGAKPPPYQQQQQQQTNTNSNSSSPVMATFSSSQAKANQELLESLLSPPIADPLPPGAITPVLKGRSHMHEMLPPRAHLSSSPGRMSMMGSNSSVGAAVSPPFNKTSPSLSGSSSAGHSEGCSVDFGAQSGKPTPPSPVLMKKGPKPPPLDLSAVSSSGPATHSPTSPSTFLSSPSFSCLSSPALWSPLPTPPSSLATMFSPSSPLFKSPFSNVNKSLPPLSQFFDPNAMTSTNFSSKSPFDYALYSPSGDFPSPNEFPTMNMTTTSGNTSTSTLSNSAQVSQTKPVSPKNLDLTTIAQLASALGPKSTQKGTKSGAGNGNFMFPSQEIIAEALSQAFWGSKGGGQLEGGDGPECSYETQILSKPVASPKGDFSVPRSSSGKDSEAEQLLLSIGRPLQGGNISMGGRNSAFSDRRNSNSPPPASGEYSKGQEGKRSPDGGEFGNEFEQETSNKRSRYSVSGGF